jgi:hypothetical protein
MGAGKHGGHKKTATAGHAAPGASASTFKANAAKKAKKGQKPGGR